MRILFYEWNSYLQYDIKDVCKRKGIRLEPFSWNFKNKNIDEAFENWFDRNVDCKQYDAIFSINYWPMLSRMAQKNDIPYIAWCYDDPLNVIDIEETLGNTVNTVLLFDRVQAQKYLDAGFDTVYHLPLGVNCGRLNKLQISQMDKKKYTTDVSLVGSLYESKMQEIRALLDDYTKGYIDAVMSAQQNLYGCYLFDDVVTDDLVQMINQNIKSAHPDTEFTLLKAALTFAMASEITRRDRLTLLALLGRRFDTRLYSFQHSQILQGVKCFPPVDYVNEMPKVFACTKINLNPILRCIQSGIPMRALDVMGAGGFLLSSYQPELAEFFVHEKEMVMYESIEDAVQKTEFLLQHEDIRKQIALNGQQKVFEHYSMEDRLKEIFQLAGLMQKNDSVAIDYKDFKSENSDQSKVDSKYEYYIMAPAKIASGGPELAHQLCFELNNIGVLAKMYYVADGNLEPTDSEALERYTKYNTSHARTFIEANQKNSIVIINESATSYIPFFPNAKKALWWMSVDNYLIDSYKLEKQDIYKHVDYHLVQSQYAYHYVKTTLEIPENKIIMLSDYTHADFQRRLFTDDMRQDIVLFNPKKGYEKIAPLIKMMPEVKWIPLINMNEQELQNIMQLAKVYIDFGNHPGKDRIPRETAISGCCIITNKEGSAAYYEDVPIPDEYKFENVKEEYETIKKKILDICQNFEEHSAKFSEYRTWIKGEKNRFTEDTINMVKIINRE